MSPEQERVLYEVLEHSVETKGMVRGLGKRLAVHEAEDEKALERIAQLERTATRLFAYWAAAVFIIPAVTGIVIALGKAAAQ